MPTQAESFLLRGKAAARIFSSKSKFMENLRISADTRQIVKFNPMTGRRVARGEETRLLINDRNVLESSSEARKYSTHIFYVAYRHGFLSRMAWIKASATLHLYWQKPCLPPSQTKAKNGQLFSQLW